MSAPLAATTARRYWTGVGIFIVVLLLTQSVMGFGIDKFKELWGDQALEVVAYLIVAVGAVGVAWVGWRLWARCAISDRVWISVALVAYGIGTSMARYPQERLHYLGYGLLAVLLYLGLARYRGESATGSAVVPALAALLVGSLVGFADELLQIVWPRRYFDWADVGMNVIAVGLGLLVAIPVWNALNRDKKPAG